MRRILVLALLVAGLAMVGCKKKPREDVAQVPPPVEPPPVAPADEPMGMPPTLDMGSAPAPVPGNGNLYVVQRGDTLWSIAKRHYGDGRRMKDIAAANNITDVNKINVGQKLILP